MTTDGVERWTQKKLEEKYGYTYTTKEDLQKRLDELADEGNSNYKGYIYGSKFSGASYQAKYGRPKTFSGVYNDDTKLDEFLEPSLSKNNAFVDRYSSRVEKATTEDQLRAIEEDAESVTQKENLSDDSLDQIQDAIQDKLAGIKAAEEEEKVSIVSKDIEKQIQEAKSFRDIEKIPLEDLPAGPERERLAEAIKDVQLSDDFESQEEAVEREISQQIATATSIEELEDIDPGQGVTSDSRRSLEELLDRRREQLS